VYGQRLPGMAIGVRTELEIARSVDKSDLDPINVHPLPAQAAVLAAFVALGFQFKSADLERGFVYGVQQTLPFYQEIEFWAAPQFQGRITEVELTFVTAPQGVEIVIELDKRGGGRDAVSRFKVGHAQAAAMDWAREIDGRMRQLGHF
jgi:sporulation-control protein